MFLKTVPSKHVTDPVSLLPLCCMADVNSMQYFLSHKIDPADIIQLHSVKISVQVLPHAI